MNFLYWDSRHLLIIIIYFMMIWCNLYGWYRQLWVSVLKPRADTRADMRSDMDFQCKTRITTLLLYCNKYFSNKSYEIFWKLKFYENFEFFWNLKKNSNFWNYELKFLKIYENFDFFQILWNFWNVWNFLKFYEIFEIFVNGIFWFSMMSNASIGNVTINIYGDNFKNP